MLIKKILFQNYIIDRLLLKNNFEDISSIQSRVSHFERSLDLLISSLIFGVGLGNYQLYNENRKEKFLITNPIRQQFYVESGNDPHSIISKTIGETGFLGLISLFLMIISFLKKDIKSITKKSSFDNFAYIVSFWGLFILSLITPSITIFRGGWMWFIRGLIDGKSN